MGNNKINAVRGMNDILPEESVYWQYLQTNFQEVASSYGYKEIRTPIVEDTSLFIRSIGEVTDIVEKETYTFNDRNGDSLTLRPEGTAGTVRAGIENGLFYKQTQRLWYCGPFFRHERPQKGRYRQFYQLGLEAFGMPGSDIDIELLFLTWRLWQKLGLSEHLELQINSLGLTAERAEHRKVLIEYFEKNVELLDDDSKRRLHKNPLRILDSKNPAMEAMLNDAPKLQDFMGEASLQHFAQICAALDIANVPYRVNPRLVRGMDYYCHMVFEWVTTELGAQGTVCAGGRYDGLIAEIGGDAVPAVGFAMGMERLILLLKHYGLALSADANIYFVSLGEQARLQALLLTEECRTALPTISIVNHCGEDSFKSQMKRADKSGADIAIILGEDELQNQQVSIKYLRIKQEQETITQTELVNKLQQIF